MLNIYMEDEGIGQAGNSGAKDEEVGSMEASKDGQKTLRSIMFWF